MAAGSVASASTSSSRPVARGAKSRLKFSGMLTTNCTSAARQGVARLRLRVHLPDEIEVAAVLHRLEQRPALRPVVGQQHGGGQMLGVGIDGKAEEDQLHAAECRSSWRRSRRSRRIWMNSLTTMAQNRSKEKP